MLSSLFWLNLKPISLIFEEIEESLEANVVERKLNDLLLADEAAGKVRIQRDVALVGCVCPVRPFKAFGLQMRSEIGSLRPKSDLF